MEILKTGAPPYGQLSAGEKRRIRKIFEEKVSRYSRLMGLSAGRIAIRNQRTRWGSCSSKGNLNFNYQLCYMPERLLDYVVIHELAHLRQMNHSREFWREVEKYCPDYRDLRKELKRYTPVQG